MVRRVKHLDNGLAFMPIQCEGVIFLSFSFFLMWRKSISKGAESIKCMGVIAFGHWTPFTLEVESSDIEGLKKWAFSLAGSFSHACPLILTFTLQLSMGVPWWIPCGIIMTSSQPKSWAQECWEFELLLCFMGLYPIVLQAFFQVPIVMNSPLFDVIPLDLWHSAWHLNLAPMRVSVFICLQPMSPKRGPSITI